MIRGTSRGKQMAVAPVGLYQIACQDWGQQEGMPSLLASTGPTQAPLSSKPLMKVSFDTLLPAA